MSHRGGSGNWNRAGRRSGGDRSPIIAIDISARRHEKALDAATNEFQQEVTRLTMNLVLLTFPGIGIEDALKECGRLLHLVAEECEAAKVLPPEGGSEGSSG